MDSASVDTRLPVDDNAPSTPHLSADQKMRVVSKFIAQARRDISTTLRDTRDDDTVFVLLGSLRPHPDGDGMASLAPIPRKLRESDIVDFGTHRTGVQFCLDQIRSLKPTAHEASDVIVGVRFSDGDIFTVITRVA